jgi:hypothetical protein
MNRQRQEPQRGAAGRQVAVLPEPHQVGAMVVAGVKGFARRHPIVSVGFVAGWLVLLLVGSGTALTVSATIQAIRSNNEHHRPASRIRCCR